MEKTVDEEMNNKRVEVSIFCLTYNHRKYISKALEGMLNQKTDFLYEILIHDDASTDGTQEIIRQYEEKYPNIIRAVYERENKFGKSNYSKDIFLPMMKGRYVAYCEGDDYWCDDNKLQMQYDVLKKCDSLAMCVHKVQRRSEDDTMELGIIPSRKMGDGNDLVLSRQEYAKLLYRGGYPFHTTSYFVKKEVIEKYLSFNRVGLDGDDLILRHVLLFGDVYYINKTMSVYRIGSSSSVTKKLASSSLEKQFRNLINRCEDDMRFDDLSNNEYHSLIINYCCDSLLTKVDEMGAEQVMAVLKKLMIRWNSNGLNHKNRVKIIGYTYVPDLMNVVLKCKRKVRSALLRLIKTVKKVNICT